MTHETDRQTGSRDVLCVRSRVLQAIRGYFQKHDFIEVETPLRIPAPAPEVHIDAESAGERFLRPSPELHLKRLLAAGYERIFELGPCFRRGERGHLHNPEFCMLEWYRTGADYIDMLADTKALINHVLMEVLQATRIEYGGRTIEMMPIWDCLAVSDVFKAYAGWDPAAEYDAERFDVDLVLKVEPSLPIERPVVLKDYPAPAAALSRCRPDMPPVAERWELYIAGIELANAYTELTDPEEQRARFEAWQSERKALGRDEYPAPEGFLSDLQAGLPACGGVALGVDRLVMLLTDSPRIEDVRTFV